MVFGSVKPATHEAIVLVAQVVDGSKHQRHELENLQARYRSTKGKNVLVSEQQIPRIKLADIRRIIEKSVALQAHDGRVKCAPTFKTSAVRSYGAHVPIRTNQAFLMKTDENPSIDHRNQMRIRNMIQDSSRRVTIDTGKQNITIESRFVSLRLRKAGGNTVYLDRTGGMVLFRRRPRNIDFEVT
jgi:hypothetical protein